MLAEGRHISGRRPKLRAAKPREKTSGTERCFLPSPLTFELFIGLNLYANQIGSLQLWSCGPAREEMSIILRKTSWSLKFIALREIVTESHSWCSFSLSCNPFFEIWITGSENHYPWEFNILLKTLTSWAQRDKTLQETVTFTDNKKIAENYADPVLWRK